MNFMKWTFFSGFITCISLSAASQAVQPLREFFPKPKTGIYRLQNKTYLPKQRPDISFLQNQKVMPRLKLTDFPVNGTVYALPPDNMPCLVPDLTTVAKIPTMKPYIADLSIPNPYWHPDTFPVLK